MGTKTVTKLTLRGKVNMRSEEGRKSIVIAANNKFQTEKTQSPKAKRSSSASKITKTKTKDSPRRSKSEKKPRKSNASTKSVKTKRKTIKETGDPNTIFAGGLPHEATEDEVKELFSKYGKLTSLNMPTRYDKLIGGRRHRGFAYITFEKGRTAKDLLRRSKVHMAKHPTRHSIEIKPGTLKKALTESPRRKSRSESKRQKSVRAERGEGKRKRRKSKAKKGKDLADFTPVTSSSFIVSIEV